MIRFVILGFSWFLGIAAFLVLLSPVYGRESLGKEKLQLEQNKLDKLKREIQATKKKQERTRRKHDVVLQSIEGLDREMQKHRNEFDVINRDLNQADLDLENISRQLSAVYLNLKTKKKIVAARLRHLYMEGKGGWFRPLVYSDSYAHFQRRLTYVSTLARLEHKLLELYKNDISKFEKFKGTQAEFRRTLLRTKRQTEKKITAMKVVKEKKNVVLASLKQKTLSQNRMLAALERAEDRKEALLEGFEQRSQITTSMTQKGRMPILRKGAFLWPTDGTVITVFGRQKHPTFDTYINKKGIEIKTAEGSVIRAVSSGTVVYADWLKGYGLVVIIDHQNGFFSLYAHASKLLVQKTNQVLGGAIIGETGESGLTDKNILYFELRKGTKPLNPLQWLVKRP